MRRVFHLFSCILFAFSGIVLGQDAANVREMVLHADDALLAARARMVGGHATSISANGRKLEWTFVIYSTADGRSVRNMTYENGYGQQEVFDGKTLWVYTPRTNGYTRHALTAAPVPRELAGITSGRHPETLEEAVLLRTEALPFVSGKVLCDVVLATYKRSVGLVDRTVWIARDSHFILRDKSEIRDRPQDMPGPNTYDYTKIILDPPGISDELFTFTPPPDSHDTSPKMSPPVPMTKEPVLQHQVPAEYTDAARAAGLQGVVSLMVEIEPDGSVHNIEIRRSLGLGLDERAVAAVKQWKYEPPAGQNPLRHVVDVPFRLQPSIWSVESSNFRVRDTRSGSASKPSFVEYVPVTDKVCGSDIQYAVVSLEITRDGDPENVRVGGTANQEMKKAVASAVSQWRFKPGAEGRTHKPSSGSILLSCRPPGSRSVAAPPDAAVPTPGRMSQPKVLYKFDPEYSPEARKEKISGNILIQVAVEPDGTPSSLRVVRALGRGLDEEALDAVRQWRFYPGMKDGEPVRVVATVEVNFRLL